MLPLDNDGGDQGGTDPSITNKYSLVFTDAPYPSSERVSILKHIKINIAIVHIVYTFCVAFHCYRYDPLKSKDGPHKLRSEIGIR